MKGLVQFNDVSFHYEGADENVLEHVTFTARPGETTAFIGSTGSGKSTLINLIPRFYDVSAGSVTVDGVDVRDIPQHELRDAIGYVPQKGVLFSGDISSNLRYGGEDADADVLRRAAEVAQATEFIDELPDGFIDRLNRAAKAQDENAMVLGEVWEDASNKTAYGVRRRYLLGGQLDSVMNYPFRDAILGFLLGEHASLIMDRIETIVENYPPQVLRILMNHIGTHDTERALTVLGGEPAGSRGREWQSAHTLSPEQRETGLERMRLAAFLQFMLPGVPCIYYGDEAGMEGYRDPFNRACYPWGHEDEDLIAWYRYLGLLRQEHGDILKGGGLRSVYAHDNVLSFERYVETEGGEDALFVAVNRSMENAVIPGLHLDNAEFIFGAPYPNPVGGDFKLPPFGFTLLRIHREKMENGES